MHEIYHILSSSEEEEEEEEKEATSVKCSEHFFFLMFKSKQLAARNSAILSTSQYDRYNVDVVFERGII